MFITSLPVRSFVLAVGLTVPLANGYIVAHNPLIEPEFQPPAINTASSLAAGLIMMAVPDTVLGGVILAPPPDGPQVMFRVH